MRPATQEERVLRNPNFRQFNVFTAFSHWDLTTSILMGFTPSNPVSYSIYPFCQQRLHIPEGTKKS